MSADLSAKAWRKWERFVFGDDLILVFMHQARIDALSYTSSSLSRARALFLCLCVCVCVCASTFNTHTVTLRDYCHGHLRLRFRHIFRQIPLLQLTGRSHSAVVRVLNWKPPRCEFESNSYLCFQDISQYSRTFSVFFRRYQLPGRTNQLLIYSVLEYRWHAAFRRHALFTLYNPIHLHSCIHRPPDTHSNLASKSTCIGTCI